MESKELLELISLENSLAPLKNRFNEHKNRRRFIALLSPS
jgi:hypothetical protein